MLGKDLPIYFLICYYFFLLRHPPDLEKNYDAQLTLDMASVMYVHTKRFIAEIMAFFNMFTEKQQVVMKGIQAATSGQSVSFKYLKKRLNFYEMKMNFFLPCVLDKTRTLPPILNI